MKKALKKNDNACIKYGVSVLLLDFNPIKQMVL